MDHNVVPLNHVDCFLAMWTDNHRLYQQTSIANQSEHMEDSFNYSNSLQTGTLFLTLHTFSNSSFCMIMLVIKWPCLVYVEYLNCIQARIEIRGILKTTSQWCLVNILWPHSSAYSINLSTLGCYGQNRVGEKTLTCPIDTAAKWWQDVMRLTGCDGGVYLPAPLT